MTLKETIKRYLLFIISLFISAEGIALTRHAELGVSPISSIANVVSYKLPSLSFGVLLIIWNCILILVQIIVLRKDFNPVQLLQVPLSVLFGIFVDFGMWTVSFIPAGIYPVRLALVAAGTIVLGFGISLSVTANVIMNSGEAIVKAISDKYGTNFGMTKITLDVSYVIIAVILSLIFFDFKIVGTREGTVIAALTTGLVVNFFYKRINKTVSSLLCDKNAPAKPQSPLLEIMKKDVYTVNENASLIEALKLISEKKVSGMPVTDDNDRLTGFISDGDIIRFLSDSYPSFVNIYSFITIDFDSRLKEIVHTKVKNISRKSVVTVNADDDISEQTQQKTYQKSPCHQRRSYGGNNKCEQYYQICAQRFNRKHRLKSGVFFCYSRENPPSLFSLFHIYSPTRTPLPPLMQVCSSFAC